MGEHDHVKAVGIGASYNKFKSRKKADRSSVKGAVRYHEKGAVCVSFKLNRAKDDNPDELKFQMPVFSDYPYVSMTALDALYGGQYIKNGVIEKISIPKKFH